MIVYYLGLIGIVVFAVSGALAAGEKKFDWVGVIFLAVITSLGGGTLRDVLLNREFVFWIQDPNYLLVAIFSAFLTIFYCKFFKPPVKSLLIADALGLALFSIVGAQIAESMGVHTLIVIVMGVLTGVFGGVLRDTFSNDEPLLFKQSETIYSVAAFIGISIYIILKIIGVHEELSAVLGVIVISVLRISAIVFSIKLPVFTVEKD